MIRAAAIAVALATSALLVGLWVRALPVAAQREKTGRDNHLRAVCGTALRPSESELLGPLPTPAPDFKLKDFAGREVSLSSLRGRVVLVNFWATWCPPCVAEMASLERLAKSEKHAPFSLLAVSVDEDWDTVRRFFEKGTPLTVLLDSERTAPRRYGTEKFPESFLVDKQGNVRFFVVSERDWSSPGVRACIDALVAD